MKNDPWKRLADAARAHPAARSAPAGMPFGFDTRVLSQVRPAQRLTAELWARLALEAVPLGVAALLVCWLAVGAPALATASDVLALADEVFEEVLQP